jgi:hypothetical protein
VLKNSRAADSLNVEGRSGDDEPATFHGLSNTSSITRNQVRWQKRYDAPAEVSLVGVASRDSGRTGPPPRFHARPPLSFHNIVNT